MYEDLPEQIEKAILAKVSITLGINSVEEMDEIWGKLTHLVPAFGELDDHGRDWRSLSVEEINALPFYYNHFLLED